MDLLGLSGRRFVLPGRISHLELTFVAEKLPPVHTLEQVVLIAADASEEYE